MTAAPAPHICAHCDDTGAHVHTDPHAVVRTARQRLRVFTWVRIGLAAALLAGLVAAFGSAQALVPIGGGLAAWVGVTAIGLGVTLALGALGRARRLVLAALVAAALTPVAALVLSGLLDGGAWVGLGGGLGWFLGAAGTEVVRSVRLRTLLAANSRDGEVARNAVVRDNEHTSHTREFLWTVATAVAFGTWVSATAALPVVVVVLVPLQVALSVLTRRWRAAPAGAAD